MAFRGIQATNIISNTVGFSDPIFVTNKDGFEPTDVGFLGKIGPTHYAGLVRDAETNSFLLLDSISLTSSTVNDVNALDGTIIKGDLHVNSLTAYSIVAANVTGNVTGQVTGSLNGNVTGRLYGDVHGNVTSPTSLVPIITTGPVKDTLTIHDAEVEKLKAPSSSGGATIVNTTGADTFFGHNAHLTGTLYGDIGDTLAHNPVLTVGTGNNDSQLGVTVASIDELQVNDSYILPKGTAAQRPSTPAEGMMWFNTTTKMFEGYNGTDWVQLVPSTFVETP